MPNMPNVSPYSTNQIASNATLTLQTVPPPTISQQSNENQPANLPTQPILIYDDPYVSMVRNKKKKKQSKKL